MNKLMLEIAMPVIVGVMKELLNKENIQRYGDHLFDFIEQAIESSETTFDDKLVLPIVKSLRAALDIPDND